MLSKKSKYAIKALVVLAKRYESGWPMRISVISDSENIPRKFLETILLELRNHGILGSKLGINGGYYLIKPPEQIKLSQIIRYTDGPIALVTCASLNFYERCHECVDENTCEIKHIALRVRDASLEILEKTSLLDIISKEAEYKLLK